MPEYTYLLEKRLSAPQKNALQQIRDAARDAGTTIFLVGGAVRDLTTGSSVRDLDFAVQGNALDLEAAIVARGGEVWGRHKDSRTLFLWFPGSVRIEVSSTRTERYTTPGKPEYTWTGIIDDLFRRDFTANAMALSLNEGSYGLLLDPLNGVADIESRQLRLVSNYGFIEDPSRLIRAVRLRYRLGWQLEERTAARFENAGDEETFARISPQLRGYELEKLAAEEEALGVLKALEEGGWMRKLLPSWTSASVDTAALDDVQRNRIQLLMQGIAPDLTAVHLEVMTARMKREAREELKAMLVRPGLRAQWEGLEASAREFGKRLTAKEAATASASWKLFHSSPAEAILWLAHTRKGSALDSKFKDLFSIWPEAAKRVPVALMLEMRITPELASYAEILHEMFLRQIDGQLETDEQMRAFLEPYSPPAPPPPVTLRRSRGKKAEKGRRKEAAREPDDDDEDDEPRSRAKSEDEDEEEDGDESERDSDSEEEERVPDKPAAEKPPVASPPKPAPRPAPVAKPASAPAAKPVPAPKPAPAAKPVPAAVPVTGSTPTPEPPAKPTKAVPPQAAVKHAPEPVAKPTAAPKTAKGKSVGAHKPAPTTGPSAPAPISKPKSAPALVKKTSPQAPGVKAGKAVAKTVKPANASKPAKTSGKASAPSKAVKPSSAKTTASAKKPAPVKVAKKKPAAPAHAAKAPVKKSSPAKPAAKTAKTPAAKKPPAKAVKKARRR